MPFALHFTFPIPFCWHFRSVIRSSQAVIEVTGWHFWWEKCMPVVRRCQEWSIWFTLWLWVHYHITGAMCCSVQGSIILWELKSLRSETAAIIVITNILCERRIEHVSPILAILQCIVWPCSTASILWSLQYIVLIQLFIITLCSPQ